jgi:hypothetical protein
MKMHVALGETKAMSSFGFETFAAFDVPVDSTGRRLSGAEGATPEISIGFAVGDEVANVKIGEVALLNELPELKWTPDPEVLLVQRESMTSALTVDFGEPGSVQCAKITDEYCMSERVCSEWRNATCVMGECVCGAGLCANEIGACIPYEGVPGVLAKNPCLTTDDNLETIVGSEVLRDVGGEFDKCAVLTPRTFIRFDYSTWQNSWDMMVGGRRLEGGSDDSAAVPKMNLNIESHISLPVIDVGEVRTQVGLATVDGEIEAMVKQGDMEVSQKLGEAPACTEGKIDVCVGLDGSDIVLDVCAPTMPCVMQVVAHVDEKGGLHPRVPESLVVKTEENSAWARFWGRLHRVAGIRVLCFVAAVFLVACVVDLVKGLDQTNTSQLVFFKLFGFHWKRVYSAKKPWFEDFPTLEDEDDYLSWYFQSSPCVLGYFAYRRSVFLVCWVFSLISALSFIEGLFIAENAAEQGVGEASKLAGAAPGPLNGMLEDAATVFLVKRCSVLLKVLTPSISAIVSWRSFKGWNEWKVSNANLVNGFLFRFVTTILVSAVPWFYLPLSHRDAAKVWPVVASLLANWPAISLCLGLTSAMMRSVKNVAALLPVAVVHQQCQIAVPFIAALFLWPVFSTANHLAQNVVLLYGFQLRVLAPCIVALWAFVFQEHRVGRTKRKLTEDEQMRKEQIKKLSTRRRTISQGNVMRVLSNARISINSITSSVRRLSGITAVVEDNDTASVMSPRASMSMEKISMDFLTDKYTKRFQKMRRFVDAISGLLILYGVYEMIVNRNMSEEAVEALLESGIPAAFMAVGDMLFMELVASDLVVNCCVRLNIFNGFMERDEDLYALVCIMGLERLTGRGAVSAESIRRETISPLRSSRRHIPNGFRSNSMADSMPSDIVFAELAMLRELQNEWQKMREKYKEGLGALVAALGDQEETGRIARGLHHMVSRRDSLVSTVSLDSEDLRDYLMDGGESSRRSSKNSKVSIDADAVVIEGLDEATASNLSQDQSTVPSKSRSGAIYEIEITQSI